MVEVSGHWITLDKGVCLSVLQDKCRSESSQPNQLLGQMPVAQKQAKLRDHDPSPQHWCKKVEVLKNLQRCDILLMQIGITPFKMLCCNSQVNWIYKRVFLNAACSGNV